MPPRLGWISVIALCIFAPGLAWATTGTESEAASKAWSYSSPAQSIMPGTDVKCIALTNIPRAHAAACTLFGPSGSGCEFSQQLENGCATFRSDEPMTPSISQVPDKCRPHCKEFDILIPGSAFALPGQWHLAISFFDSHGRIIQIHPPDRSITILSIFVLPESQAGSIALVGASMSALGGFYYLRRRTSGKITSEDKQARK